MHKECCLTRNIYLLFQKRPTRDIRIWSHILRSTIWFSILKCPLQNLTRHRTTTMKTQPTRATTTLKWTITLKGSTKNCKKWTIRAKPEQSRKLHWRRKSAMKWSLSQLRRRKGKPRGSSTSTSEEVRRKC